MKMHEAYAKARRLARQLDTIAVVVRVFDDPRGAGDDWNAVTEETYLADGDPFGGIGELYDYFDLIEPPPDAGMRRAQPAGNAPFVPTAWAHHGRGAVDCSRLRE